MRISYCLPVPQRLKTTVFESFSNGVAVKERIKKFQNKLILAFEVFTIIIKLDLVKILKTVKLLGLSENIMHFPPLWRRIIYIAIISHYLMVERRDILSLLVE